jgi:hypothetical protein
MNIGGAQALHVVDPPRRRLAQAKKCIRYCSQA